MPSSRTSIASAAHAFVLLNLFTASVLALDQLGHQRLHKRGDPQYVACYSFAGSLQEANTWPWQSQGYCSDHCEGAVIGLTDGNACFCGNEIPADSDKVDDSKCSVECVGWPSVNCGANGFWSVWTTGKGTATTASGSGSSSSSSSSSSSNGNKNSASSSSPPSVVTSQVIGGSTVIVTVPATSTPTNDAQSSKGGGSSGNTAGIAAGVVVGVVALAAIVGGIYFFLRHRKQKQAEEDYKQRSQVADFMRGSNERKPPSTGYSGMSDARLDPEAGRRNSVGSLADNQDYSRRILRVANPDDS